MGKATGSASFSNSLLYFFSQLCFSSALSLCSVLCCHVAREERKGKEAASEGKGRFLECGQIGKAALFSWMDGTWELGVRFWEGGGTHPDSATLCKVGGIDVCSTKGRNSCMLCFPLLKTNSQAVALRFPLLTNASGFERTTGHYKQTMECIGGLVSRIYLCAFRFDQESQ